MQSKYIIPNNAVMPTVPLPAHVNQLHMEGIFSPRWNGGRQSLDVIDHNNTALHLHLRQRRGTLSLESSGQPSSPITPMSQPMPTSTSPMAAMISFKHMFKSSSSRKIGSM